MKSTKISKLQHLKKKIQFTTKYQLEGVRVRVGPDPALARPYRARVKPTRGQGHAEGGPAQPLDSVPGSESIILHPFLKETGINVA